MVWGNVGSSKVKAENDLRPKLEENKFSPLGEKRFTSKICSPFLYQNTGKWVKHSMSKQTVPWF